MSRFVNPLRSGALAAVVLIASGASLGACASAPAADVHWEAIVAYEGETGFERIRAGRPDASDPNLQLVGVDQAGDTILVHMDGSTPRSSVIYRHGIELTGLVMADLDPAIPGDEIYVGGYAEGSGREGTGGTVVQLVVTPEGVRSRRVFTTGTYVHAMEALEPSAPGGVRRLLVTDYAGQLHVLTPGAGDAQWTGPVVYRDPASSDPESTKIKDIVLLRDPSGRTPHEAFMVLKTGRVIVVDLDRPGSGRVVHEEEGGLSRALPDETGGAYFTGYFGRVLHLVREGDAFRLEVMDNEGKDSGLRGIVQGRFPTPGGGVAPFAIYGFHTLVRTLTPRLGAWDTTTIFRDLDRGHAFEVADLIPGNDADELIAGGYSKRITILIAR